MPKAKDTPQGLLTVKPKSKVLIKPAAQPAALGEAPKKVLIKPAARKVSLRKLTYEELEARCAALRTENAELTRKVAELKDLFEQITKTVQKANG